MAQSVQCGERVAVYLEKPIEKVAAMFGLSLAGAVLVPVNPLLKAEQMLRAFCQSAIAALINLSSMRIPVIGRA